MGNSSSDDQRAHPRYNVFLDALLTGKGLESKACKIRDICVGGMFLSFEGPAGEVTYSSQTPIRAGDEVGVHFYVPHEGRDHAYDVQAKVARVLSAGIGVAFTDIQPATLQTLMHFAKSRGEERPAAPPRTGGLSAAEKDRLSQLTRTWFKQDLGAWMSDFFRKAEDKLFLASREATDSQMQRRYWDAIEVLKSKRQNAEREIYSALLEQFDHVGAKVGGSKIPGEDTQPGSELSLVNTREFEDFLVISETVDKAETYYKAQLFELQQRLSFVFGLAIDMGNNPVGAGAISHAFCDAMHAIGLDPDAFKVVLQAYSDGVVPEFSRFYQRLNAELQKEGVPLLEQRSKPEVPRPRRSAPPPQSAGAPSVPPTPAAPVGSPVEGLPDLFDPESTAGMVPGAAQMVRQYMGTGAGVPSPAGPAPQAGIGQGASAPAAPGVGGVGMPGGGWQPGVAGATGTARTAHTLFGLRRQLQAAPAPVALQGAASPAYAGPAGTAAVAMPPQSAGYQAAMPGAGTGIPATEASIPETASYFGQEELTAAMQSLEPELVQTQALDPAVYRRQLEGALDAKGGDGPPKAVNEQDWDILELVLELFNAILNDGRVITDVKPYVGRLRTPVNRLALAEPAFLEDQAHPGRRLLNRLAEVRSLGGKDPATSIRPRIEQIIERVMADSGTHPAVFGEAADEVEQIVAEQAREFAQNLQQLAKTSEEQQQFLKARRNRDGAEKHATPTAGMSEEWAEWLTRARRLKVGDELELGSGTQKRRVTVAWVGEDQNSYVLADTIGQKVASVGLQELAMQLRRGSAKVFGKTEMPAVERALFTSLQNLHGKLEAEASSDAVTRVLNADAFNDALDEAIVQAQRDSFHHVLAVVCLDQFDELVGAASEETAQAVLRETAACLHQTLGEEVKIGRVGDHDFGMLFTDCSQGQGFEKVESARAAIAATPLQLAEESVSVAPALTLSAGIVPFGDEAQSREQLLEVAGRALQFAHEAGGNTVRLHHIESVENATAKSRALLAEQLESALAEDRLQLSMQRVAPQREDPNLPTHVELSPSLLLDAGVRMEPVALRRVAELRKKSLELDRWLVHAALQWVVDNVDSLPANGWCIIKLSAASLNDAGLTNFLVDELMNTAVPPSRLCFELTDTSNLERRSDVDEVVHSLHEFGCHFAIGDFGNEHSSLAGVKDLQVDLVKVGRMGHRNLARNPTDVALVRSVVEMAHFLGAPVWTDHIDDAGTLAKLAELNVEYAQGAAVSPFEALS
jgi:diguanylate cyclase (GGDEF)-like protein